MANIVAIVGRPNVGKSTFFNRLVEKRQAIMDNESGTTRDRHYGYGEWNGKHFTVIDTGGYVIGSKDRFEEAIRQQVKIALEEASVIIFMVDCFDGMTGLDKDFAKIVRATKRPVYVAANKADNTERTFMTGEFYALGLGQVFAISSANGFGTGEILDQVVKHFSDDGDENPNEGIPRVAILGRPNVGKSSFVNALLGKERSIVLDQAGTTRDAIHTHYRMYGKDFILTDTAGIRKKPKVVEDIEFYSVIRAIQVLQDTDVCIVILDAERGLESQDLNILSMAIKYNKGVTIMVNKWDLIEKDHKSHEVFKKAISEKLAPNNFIPILFSSVLKKQRIFQVVEKAIEVYDNRNIKIPTSKINEVMLPEIERYPPPALKGKHIKIKYITQLPTKMLSFAFFCNLPQYIKMPYQRYLENKMRTHFQLEGVPIKIFFRKK